MQALLEAQREAEERRLQDQATLELERERSRLREQQLMSQQSVAQPREREEGELEAELARLQLADTRQREEISRSAVCMCTTASTVFGALIHFKERMISIG